MQNLLFKRTPCALNHREHRAKHGAILVRYPALTGHATELRNADRYARGSLVVTEDGEVL